MKLNRVIRRMGRMCDAAWTVFERGAQLSLTLIACALLLTTADPASAEYAGALHTANAMLDTSEAVLLLTALLPAIIEDQQSRR